MYGYEAIFACGLSLGLVNTLEPCILITKPIVALSDPARHAKGNLLLGDRKLGKDLSRDYMTMIPRGRNT